MKSGISFAATRAVTRFPVPMACVFTALILALCEPHESWRLGDGMRWRGLMQLGFFAALAVVLYGEARGLSRPCRHALALLAMAAVAIAVYAVPGDEESDFLGWLFLSLVLILVTMAAPFVGRGASDDTFWEFNRRAAIGAAFGLFLALVVAGALSAALSRFESLTGLALPESAYGHIWMLSLGVGWPWFALARLPVDLAAAPDPYRLLWAPLLGCLLVLLTLTFLVSSYAIGLVALVKWELPRGQIGWTTAVLAALGVVGHTAVYAWRNSEIGLLRFFTRTFYVLIIPPIALLAIAVGVRIAVYGVTGWRYLLFVLVVWLALLSASWMLGRFRLALVPLSLAVLLVMAAYGPLSLDSVTSRSQMAILGELLSANGLLIDGRVVPARAPIPAADNQRITSVIKYLVGSGRRQKLAPWMQGSGLDFHPGKAIGARPIMHSMGLEPIGPGWLPQFYFRFVADAPWDGDKAGYAVAPR